MRRLSSFVRKYGPFYGPALLRVLQRISAASRHGRLAERERLRRELDALKLAITAGTGLTFN